MADADGRDDATTPDDTDEPVPATVDVDPRFTYANERTFLAWIRTALALITAGLVVTQFFRPFALPFGRRLIGIPLIVLGGVVAIVCYRSWIACDAAMEHGEKLPRSPLPVILVVGILAIGVMAGILVAFFPAK